MTIKPAGIELPSSYNAADHKAIHVRMNEVLLVDHPNGINIRHVFSTAWIGLAYRLRATIDYHEEFRRAITSGTAPPPMDRYRQETALFTCIVSGLSTIECFSMGAYAVGAAKATPSFPLQDRRNLLKYPHQVVSAFETDYSGHPFAMRARTIVDSAEYRRLDDLRNVLAHRGVLPRSHTEDTYNGTFESAIPSNPKSLATDWDYATILNDDTTNVYVMWVCRAVNDLLSDLRALADS